MNIGGLIGPVSGDYYMVGPDNTIDSWISRITTSMSAVWVKTIAHYTHEDSLAINSLETKFYITFSGSNTVIYEMDASNGNELREIHV